ncbi:MAG: preprotein translocase subunit SecG [Thermoguttaceae bacterium]|jgi:preprotein translocase subunit SecG
MPVILMILLILTGIFLIVLILIQRGKGGGLAGAFGGMGGQSAFGTKAGDLFTRITIGAAAFWIILCIVSVRLMGTSKELIDVGTTNPPGQQSSIPASQEKQSAPMEKQPAPGGEKPAGDIPSTPSKSQ